MVKVELGDGNIFNAEFVVAQSIENSFNRVADSGITDGLKEQLVSLASHVGTLVEHLPQDSAEAVKDDLDTLTREALRAEPRRKWWELGVEGLHDAAVAIGEIGQPILRVLETLVPYLERGSN